jgi:dihydroorotate dehydrogenase electron transfer subunit
MQPRGQFQGVVSRNEPICDEHFRLKIRVEGFPESFPGQFIQLTCGPFDPEARGTPDRAVDWSEGAIPVYTDPDHLGAVARLRRPFSLAGRADHNGLAELEVIHRVVGVGTRYLSRLCEGDAAYLIGPLGNRFTLPPEGGTAILVGGGVGIPPMLYLAESLRGKRAVAFAGAVSRRLLPLEVLSEVPAPRSDSVLPLYNIAEFARNGIGTVVSTDDGSYGFHGRVTGALQRYLDEFLYSQADRSAAVVYTCGPEPMMKAVVSIAAERGIACQVAVERAMACGMGTCQSCCIRVRKPDPQAVPLPGKDWCYRLACTDGPVFAGTDLLW